MHLQRANEILSGYTGHKPKGFGAPEVPSTVLWWNSSAGVPGVGEQWECKDYRYLSRFIREAADQSAERTIEAVIDYVNGEIRDQKTGQKYFVENENIKTIQHGLTPIPSPGLMQGGYLAHVAIEGNDEIHVVMKQLKELLVQVKRHAQFVENGSLRGPDVAFVHGRQREVYSTVLYHLRFASYQNFAQTMFCLKHVVMERNPKLVTYALYDNLSSLSTQLHLLSLYHTPLKTGDEENRRARWRAIQFLTDTSNGISRLSRSERRLNGSFEDAKEALTSMMRKAGIHDEEAVCDSLEIFMDERMNEEIDDDIVLVLESYEDDIREFLKKELTYLEDQRNEDDYIYNNEDPGYNHADDKFSATVAAYTKDQKRLQQALDQQRPKRKREPLDMASAKKFKQDISDLQYNPGEVDDQIERFFYILRMYPRIGIVSPPFDTVEQYEKMKRGGNMPEMPGATLL